MEHVIYSRSYGMVEVYLATMENAKKIFENHMNEVEPEVIKIYEKNLKVLNKQKIAQLMNKILYSEEDTMVSKTIKATKEIKQEVVMYCFNKKINIEGDKINEYDFFKSFNVNDFSFLANNENYNQGCAIVDDYIIEQSHSYGIIIEDLWKENVKDINKIRYILKFLQDIVCNDVKYEVVEVKQSF